LRIVSIMGDLYLRDLYLLTLWVVFIVPSIFVNTSSIEYLATTGARIMLVYLAGLMVYFLQDRYGVIHINQMGGIILAW
jgi:hypothetical protein